MTSTYTSNLNIEKPATGDQVDQWGPTVNDNMDLIDTAVTANLPKAGGTMTGDLILADNVRLEIGSESNGDLALYHDGSNSYIDERGTGELKIKGSNIRLEDNSATLGLFLDGTNDNIALYQSGNVKLQTVSNGINVTGNLAVTGTVDGRDVATDGSTLDATTTTANAALSRAGGTMVGHLLHEDSVSSKFGTGNDFSINFDGNFANLTSAGTEPIRVLTDNFIVMNRAGSYNVMNMPTANAGIDFSYNGTRKFGIESYGIDVVGNVQVSGTVDGVDIASRDGVLTSTTTTANAALARTGGSMTGQISFGDNVKANFGNSNDLEIYHDGNDSYIKDSAGTGDLLIQTNKLQIVKANALDTMAEFIGDGAVKLRYDDGVRFETNANGCQITGTVSATTASLSTVNATNANIGGMTIASNGLSCNGTLNCNLVTAGTLSGVLQNGQRFENGAWYDSNEGKERFYFYNNGSSLWNTADAHLFQHNGSTKFTVDSGGNATSVGNMTAYSDIRLKSGITTIDNALDKVSQMRGVTFYKDGEFSSGVIAQEMEKVAPELVMDGEYKSVAYGNTVGYLIEAIKELKAEVEELKTTKLCECK